MPVCVFIYDALDIVKKKLQSVLLVQIMTLLSQKRMGVTVGIINCKNIMMLNFFFPDFNSFEF